MDYVVIESSNGTIFNGNMSRYYIFFVEPKLPAGGFAIDVYCSTGQEWDHTVLLTLRFNDVEFFLARRLQCFLFFFFFLFFFLSFIHSSFLLWETKIHFLLIGQWGAFESIMFKNRNRKTPPLLLLSKWFDIGFLELCSEWLC